MTSKQKVELAMGVLGILHVQPSAVAWSSATPMVNTRSADEEKAYTAALKVVTAALK